MARIDEYDYVDRKHSFCWKHKQYPCWIVFYDTTHTEPFYEAFIVKDYVKKQLKNGREPWGVDNERLSIGDGFKSLEEAMFAIEHAIKLC